MKNFWVSFWCQDLTKFEYHGPWWVSGSDAENRSSVCAAVRALDETGAKKTLENCFDTGYFVDEFRFVTEKNDPGWEPFADRFQRAGWMKWPYPGGSK